MTEIARLGPALHIDETSVLREEIRFDAPGDFQLVLRDDFWAIDGFDERMLLGWHVDSNLSKRLLLHRGAIESLEAVVAGYHCNHHRTPTVYHETALANDLKRFLHQVTTAGLSEQRETWGLRDEGLEERQVNDLVHRRFTAAVLEASGASARRVHEFDAREAKFSIAYDSAHVLAFVADALCVSARDAGIAYIGANPPLERMIATLIANLDVRGPLAAPSLDSESIAAAERSADVFIVDLGVDSSLLSSPVADSHGDGPARLRAQLIRTYGALRLLVELERARIERGERPRRFVLVNSTTSYWNAYVLANMHCSSTTQHSRVRHAIVKARPERSGDAVAADQHAWRQLRWITRRDVEADRLSIRRGSVIEIADLDCYAGFGDGWAMPDQDGIWTRGTRAQLALSLLDRLQRATLTLSFDSVAQREGDAIMVTMTANGADLDLRQIPPNARGQDRGERAPELSEPVHDSVSWLRRQARAYGVTRIRPLRWLFIRSLALRSKASTLVGRGPRPKYRLPLELPAEMIVGGDLDLELIIHEPVSWLDDRRLGLHFVSLELDEPRNARPTRRLLNVVRRRPQR